MRLADITRRSSRSLLSAKTRTLLTVLAIGVGAFALTLTLSASNGAHNYAHIVINDNFDPSELIVAKDASLFDNTDTSKPQEYNASFGSVTLLSGASRQVKMLSDSDLQKLKTTPGVASVRPATSLNLQYVTRDGQRKYVGTLEAYSDYTKPNLRAGNIPKTIKPGSIILPEGFVTSLGFHSAREAIGQKIRIAVSRQVDQSKLLASLAQGGGSAALGQALNDSSNSKEELFTVIAVTAKPSVLVQPGTALYLRASNADVQRLNDYTQQNSANYHKYLSAFVTVKDGKDIANLNAAQSKIKKAGYGAQSLLDTEKTITQVINVLEGIVAVFGAISVVASVFGVVNTMYISVLQRTREIGLMKALGMHKRDINKLFLLEAGLLGFLGGLFGSILAVMLGTLLNPVISEKLSLGSVHLLDFKPVQIVVLVVLLMFIAVVAGLFPARKASRLDPIEALRTE